mgnify:CR=1 FL=1
MSLVALVIGGAGFIGSKLCKRLLHEGFRVFCLDNYSSGSTLNHVDEVVYIRGEASELASLVNFNPDLVFHLGEYSRVEQSFYDLDLVTEYNYRSIFDVVDFCKQRGAKLIYAGSSTKFGDDGLSIHESPYAWGKYVNSQYINNYAKWFGLDYATVYFYNAFGPGELRGGSYATVIGIYAHKMLNNQPLPVVSPGTQVRNFTHVDDLVEGVLIVGLNGAGDGYGIGNPVAYTIIEVAEMFGGDIEFIPERPGNRKMASIVTEKTSALGWSAKKSLENYIEELRANGWK